MVNLSNEQNRQKIVHRVFFRSVRRIFLETSAKSQEFSEVESFGQFPELVGKYQLAAILFRLLCCLK